MPTVPLCHGDLRNVDNYYGKLAVALETLICSSRGDSIAIAIGLSRRFGGNFIQRPLADAFRQIKDRGEKSPAAAILTEASATALIRTESHDAPNLGK
jgi:hypothetical protein